MDRQKGIENLSACLIIDNITENSILDSIQFDVSRSIDLFREEEQVSHLKWTRALYTTLFRNLLERTKGCHLSRCEGGDAMPECSLVPRTIRACRDAHASVVASHHRLSTFNNVGRIIPVNFPSDTGRKKEVSRKWKVGNRIVAKMCRFANLLVSFSVNSKTIGWLLFLLWFLSEFYSFVNLFIYVAIFHLFNI